MRCAWVDLKDPEYIHYHDCEWGKPVHEDQKLFEMLILEEFQAGLSWQCVLHKRENFRHAFDDFNVTEISLYAEEDSEIEVFPMNSLTPARKLKVRDLVKFMFQQSWEIDYKTILIVSFVTGIIPLITPLITETIFADIIPILDRAGLVTVNQVMPVTSFTLAALGIMRTVAEFNRFSRGLQNFVFKGKRNKPSICGVKFSAKLGIGI